MVLVAVVVVPQQMQKRKKHWPPLLFSLNWSHENIPGPSEPSAQHSDTHKGFGRKPNASSHSQDLSGGHDITHLHSRRRRPLPVIAT